MRKAEELSNPSSCMSRAHADEMTFVLLGRDVAAPVAIRAWIQERLRLNKNKATDDQIVEAARCARAMEADRFAAVQSTDGAQGGQDWTCFECKGINSSTWDVCNCGAKREPAKAGAEICPGCCHHWRYHITGGCVGVGIRCGCQRKYRQSGDVGSATPLEDLQVKRGDAPIEHLSPCSDPGCKICASRQAGNAATSLYGVNAQMGYVPSQKTTTHKTVAFYLALPYSKVLRRDEEEGYVIAKIAELPGCSTHGATESEALQALEEAQRLWIEDALEAGDPVPQPIKGGDATLQPIGGETQSTDHRVTEFDDAPVSEPSAAGAQLDDVEWAIAILGKHPTAKAVARIRAELATAQEQASAYLKFLAQIASNLGLEIGVTTRTEWMCAIEDAIAYRCEAQEQLAALKRDIGACLDGWRGSMSVLRARLTEPTSTTEPWTAERTERIKAGILRKDQEKP